MSCLRTPSSHAAAIALACTLASASACGSSHPPSDGGAPDAPGSDAGPDATEPTPDCDPGDPACRVVDIAVGDSGACALRANGTVLCWGNGALVGRRFDAMVPTPTQVSGIGDATALAVGYDHACAVQASGQVLCWGSTATTLGTGDMAPHPRPTVVLGLDDAVDVSAGPYHTCAVRRSGAIACWGWNDQGQLGDGTTEARAVPVAVVGIDDAVLVAAGVDDTCAIRATGEVACWGDNRYGQLGDGTTTSRSEPVSVSAITDAVDVSPGALRTCAIQRGGELWCWGTRTTTPEPPHVVEGISALSISERWNHGCAAGDDDGAVWCWGDDMYGQLGAGAESVSGLGRRVAGISGVVIIGVGERFTCALDDTGRVSCWGGNDTGQLGDGRTESFPSPQPVVGLTAISAISAAADHTCALDAAHHVHCWGANMVGDVIDDYRYGAQPLPFDRSDLGEMRAIAAGAGYPLYPDGVSCGVTTAGAVACWGSGARDLGLTDAVSLSIGSGNMCALRATGQLTCIGTYPGDGISHISPSPVTVAGLSDARDVAVSMTHTCAAAGTGEVWCWGRNSDNQLGGGAPTDELAPTRVAGITDATAVATGGSWDSGFSCAVRGAAGEVWCWGRYGLPDNDAPGPTPARVADGAIALSAWVGHACIVKEGGTVWCWGRNERGQLGDGSLEDRPSPVQVGSITDAIDVDVGYRHTCAIHRSGSVTCWGDNGNFELGIGPTFREAPEAVLGL